MLRVELGVFGQPQKDQMFHTLDSVSMKEIGSSSVEHDGLSSLLETCTPTADLAGATVLVDTYKGQVSLQKDISQRAKVKVRGDVNHGVLLLGLKDLRKNGFDKVVDSS